MTSVDPRIEPLLSHLADDPRLPKNAEQDIRSALAESPYLSRLIANAADTKQIGRIAVSHGQHSGGHFEDGADGAPGVLYVSESVFKDWPVKGERLDLLTEVMGHEAMHGVLSKTRTEALDAFGERVRNAMNDAYANRETTVNLTEPVRQYLDRGREDEALAEVSGLRALNSRIGHMQPALSHDEQEAALLARSKSRCVDRSSPDVQFEKGLTYEALTRYPHSRGESVTRAVEQCFYDGKATLGQHDDSDYRNYYGTHPISHIAKNYAWYAEGRRPPDVRIDLHSLGLEPKQLERNGLDLGDAKTFPVVDLGSDGFGYVQLKNTGHQRDSAPSNALSPEVLFTPANPNHPDHRMLEDIRGKVRELDQANGRTFDEVSERTSASLLALAKDNGITRVDHVLLSEKTKDLPAAQNIIVVQGDPKDPAKLRAHMPTAEAAQRPMQESFNQVEAINQRQVQEQSVEQQRTQEQQQRPLQHSL